MRARQVVPAGALPSAATSDGFKSVGALCANQRNLFLELTCPFAPEATRCYPSCSGWNVDKGYELGIDERCSRRESGRPVAFERRTCSAPECQWVDPNAGCLFLLPPKLKASPLKREHEDRTQVGPFVLCELPYLSNPSRELNQAKEGIWRKPKLRTNRQASSSDRRVVTACDLVGDGPKSRHGRGTGPWIVRIVRRRARGRA